ncbi:MAG: membrane protein of unknown function [Nitrosopumilales archaeon]|nr:MAG: membrane protein of unknown function [Nitrosopumilales archaeon]
MLRLPKTVRFFRKPDHIAFLFGYASILIVIPTESFELKIASAILFTFTIGYEFYEISQGNRQIVKADHIAFIIAYIMLLVTFWYNLQILLITSVILFGFTLAYEIYDVRRKDLENESAR